MTCQLCRRLYISRNLGPINVMCAAGQPIDTHARRGQLRMTPGERARPMRVPCPGFVAGKREARK